MQPRNETAVVRFTRRRVAVLKPHDVRAGRPKAQLQANLLGEVRRRHLASLLSVEVVAHQDGDLAALR